MFDLVVYLFVSIALIGTHPTQGHSPLHNTLQEHQKFRTETEISLISDTIYNFFWSTILTYQLEYVACIICVFNITTHYLQQFYVPTKW